jgi:hypothetical protein
LALTDLPPEDIEHGIEQFATSLPAHRLIDHLLNANPLHIDPDGPVRD